jgi:pimeloyl-ACP methyl ester carboxylesterase
MDDRGALRVRNHGTSGPRVIVLHGGPAATGHAAALARGLADSFRVLEPWQRGSGGEPLTVARHVEDLHELVESRCKNERPALVGESWGAMLALAYAAGYPRSAGPLGLVGCGTFDQTARDRLHAILEERTDNDLQQRLERLSAQFPDPGERMLKWQELTRPLYSYDPIPSDEDEPEQAPFDLRAHTETWNSMVKLQEEGIYPSSFKSIRSPVLMLHGTYDPHPGRLIRDGLLHYLPQLEYYEWERCGHSPWLEKHVHDAFFKLLREWLTRHLTEE